MVVRGNLFLKRSVHIRCLKQDSFNPLAAKQIARQETFVTLHPPYFEKKGRSAHEMQ